MFFLYLSNISLRKIGEMNLEHIVTSVLLRWWSQLLFLESVIDARAGYFCWSRLLLLESVIVAAPGSCCQSRLLLPQLVIVTGVGYCCHSWLLLPEPVTFAGVGYCCRSRLLMPQLVKLDRLWLYHGYLVFTHRKNYADRNSFKVVFVLT